MCPAKNHVYSGMGKLPTLYSSHTSIVNYLDDDDFDGNYRRLCTLNEAFVSCIEKARFLEAKNAILTSAKRVLKKSLLKRSEKIDSAHNYELKRIQTKIDAAVSSMNALKKVKAASSSSSSTPLTSSSACIPVRNNDTHLLPVSDTLLDLHTSISASDAKIRYLRNIRKEKLNLELRELKELKNRLLDRIDAVTWQIHQEQMEKMSLMGELNTFRDECRFMEQMYKSEYEEELNIGKSQQILEQSNTNDISGVFQGSLSAAIDEIREEHEEKQTRIRNSLNAKFRIFQETYTRHRSVGMGSTAMLSDGTSVRQALINTLHDTEKRMENAMVKKNKLETRIKYFRNCIDKEADFRKTGQKEMECLRRKIGETELAINELMMSMEPLKQETDRFQELIKELQMCEGADSEDFQAR